MALCASLDAEAGVAGGSEDHLRHTNCSSSQFVTATTVAVSSIVYQCCCLSVAQVAMHGTCSRMNMLTVTAGDSSFNYHLERVEKRVLHYF